MRNALRAGLLALLLVSTHSLAQFCPGVSPWVFDDVASTHPLCSDITWLAQRGLTFGCSVIDANHRLYCPNNSVRRDEMAAFVKRLSDSLTGSGGGSGWSLTGNAATDPAAQFLGTTDNKAFVVRVNNRRALRIEPNGISPNVIGGNPSNRVADNVRGATIGGGGVTPGDTDPDYGFEDETRITDHYGTIGGGYANRVGDNAGTVADRPFGAVGGGAFNHATGAYASISGGGANRSTGSYGFVGGGEFNEATGEHATIAGGHNNRAYGEHATVGGGGEAGASCYDPPTAASTRWCGNQATGDWATVGGGFANLASATLSSILGGVFNSATAYSATVGGGSENIASGAYSAVPGGAENRASGIASFAAGQNAQALHDGSFVWNSGVVGSATSSAANEFTLRTASVRVLLTSGGSCTLSSASSGWGCSSARSLKSDVEAVDAADILRRVVALPVARWTFADVPGIRHIGPMADEFHAAFNLGNDPTRLSPMDVQGVALAAIQGLNAKLDAKERELAEVKAALVALRETVERIERLAK